MRKLKQNKQWHLPIAERRCILADTSLSYEDDDKILELIKDMTFNQLKDLAKAIKIISYGQQA